MNLLEVIDAFESGLMNVCLAMLAAVVVGCAGAALVWLWRVGRLLIRRLKPIALAALVPMAALLTDFAGEKGTNMPPRMTQGDASAQWQAFSQQ